MRIAVVLIFGVAICNGYISFEGRHENAEKGECISAINEFGDFKPGEERDVPEKCELATCDESGMILYKGCEYVHLPEDCKWVDPDRSLPFPKCCYVDFTCPDK